MSPTFEDLGLHKGVLSALDQVGYTAPTEIQADGIPKMLDGRDMVAQAPTGTGKTAAFGCLLAHKTPPEEGTQALVLTPTRELARQVADEIESLCQVRGQRVLTIYGGVGYKPQIDGLERGSEIVVGTPGRIRDLIERGDFDASTCETVVLDEADRMLDMGFIEDVSWIVDHTRRDRQSLLFSATIPPGVEHLADEFCHQPANLAVGDTTKDEDRPEYLVRVGKRNRAWALERILETEQPDLAFVFCRTRHRTEKIAGLLDGHGYNAEPIQGGMSQNARERVMGRVREGDVDILVGTNVLARGIDVRRCELVVNYQPPRDPEDYIHRVGRTARMQDVGAAYTIATDEDTRAIVEIEGHTGASLTEIDVPETSQDDKITKIDDWEEKADPMGRVHFRIRGVTDSSRMDVFWYLVDNAGVSQADLGQVAEEDDGLIVKVRHDAAGRLQDHLHKNGVLGRDVDVSIATPE
jgi:ATP-dependent RNA helicase DeaD